MELAVPSRLSGAIRALGHVLVSKQRNQRKQPQQRRSGSLDRQIRPLPLRLEAQALPNLLESGLHLPASYEPGDDQLGLRIEVGA